MLTSTFFQSISTTTHNYRKVSLKEYDGSKLTPQSKLVYKQWQMDSNNDLIIDGYFRQKCEMQLSHFPTDIKQIIASYYHKKHSKSKIIKLILQRQESIKLANIRRQQKQQKQGKILDNIKWGLTQSLYVCLVACILLALLGVLFGTDIAGLIIASNNNCNLTTTSLTINDFLIYGCSLHLGLLTFMLICAIFSLHYAWDLYLNDLEKIASCAVFSCSFLIYAFCFVWSVIGFVLYQKMDKKHLSNKQCADMIMSWSVLRIIEFVGAPFVCVGWKKLFDEEI
eukprot:55249_1